MFPQKLEAIRPISKVNRALSPFLCNGPGYNIADIFLPPALELEHEMIPADRRLLDGFGQDERITIESRAQAMAAHISPWLELHQPLTGYYFR
ncbi:hypothetical protein ACFLZR_00930 [Candidatus Neomarinimicrobiota bacterium]